MESPWPTQICPKINKIAFHAKEPYPVAYAGHESCDVTEHPPCSNCISRGVKCELEIVNQPPSENASTGASELELLERIRKLELLVESQKVCDAEISKPHIPSPVSPFRKLHNATISLEVDTLDNDIAYLESIYSDNEMLVKSSHVFIESHF